MFSSINVCFGGWRDVSVGKVLALLKDLNSVPITLIKMILWHTLIISVLRDDDGRDDKLV